MLVRLLVSSLVIIGLVFNGKPADAQNGAAGITVTPVKDEFTVNPGGTSVRTVRVINPISQTMTLYPRVMDFTTDNEKGQPVFYTPKDRTSTYALSQWVTFSKPFIRVAPNEEEKFEVTITAPANAEPGGHYGAILFSTEEPKLDEDVSQIGVVGLVGTLLLATVPGDITEKLLLEDFDAPVFLINPPANFSARINNVGNIHSKPVGEIKIRNWSGNVIQTLKVNEGNSNVLPESKRRFDNTWEFDWKTIGKFTASLALTYGLPEQQLAASRTFIVIPLWLIIAIVALLLIITTLIVTRRRKRAKLKEYVNTIPPQQIQPRPPRRIIQ
jgi:hypothetical protein